MTPDKVRVIIVEVVSRDVPMLEELRAVAHHQGIPLTRPVEREHV